MNFSSFLLSELTAVTTCKPQPRWEKVGAAVFLKTRIQFLNCVKKLEVEFMSNIKTKRSKENEMHKYFFPPPILLFWRTCLNFSATD